MNVPRWLDECVTKFVPPVTMKRNVLTNGDGREVLQWEFSDGTKKLWAEILAMMLHELRRAVEKANSIRTKNGSISRPTKEEQNAIISVSLWSHNLFSYINWEEGVVQTILTETDLADSVLPNSFKGTFVA